MALHWYSGEVNLLLHDTNGPLGKYMATLCALIETAAKGHCPVDTGRLRSSITHRVEADGGEIVGVVGTSVEYAIYVHEGTRYMAGRPFLVDGLFAVVGSRGSGP